MGKRQAPTLTDEQRVARDLLAAPFVLVPDLATVGLNPMFAWFILEARAERLWPESDVHRDIDILAGRLAWRDPARLARATLTGTHPALAAHEALARGDLLWPPPVDHLIAIELKRAARDAATGRLKALKTGDGKIDAVRKQIDRDLAMGYDYVILVHIIENPPYPDPTVHAWTGAAAYARDTGMRSDLALQSQLPPDSPAGQLVISLGTVPGRAPAEAGAPNLGQLRPPLPNPSRTTPTGSTRRQTIEAQLTTRFDELPPPTTAPIVLVDCARDKCGRLHFLGEPCPATATPR